MKCPGCNKMASYEEPEVEAGSDEVNDNSINIDGRMILKSACCSEELKEWNYQLEAEISEDEHDTSKGDHDMEIEVDEPTASDYYTGKPGTPSRYRKHMYVIEVHAKVTCSCGFEKELDLKDENQASGFDELV